MDDDRAQLLALRDEAIPPLPELLGPGARDLLAVALPHALEMAAPVPAQIAWRPGHSVAVRYDACFRSAAGEATATIVAVAGRSLPEGGLVLGQREDRVALFALPHDPALPGLAAALDPVRARALLDAVDAAPGPLHTTLRAYRPGRRAVIELQAGATRAFVKVVRPSAIAALQGKHRCLAAAVPVPRSHGWSPELGLVVLEARPGHTLRATLAAGGGLPAAATLSALLDRLPPIEGAREVASPLATLPAHVDLIARAVPALRPDTVALVQALARVPAPAAPLVPVHGDFHPAQILLHDGRVTGLLDIDTVALGHRIDDWATMIGHLATWADASPQPAAVRGYARQILAFADRDSGDPAGLRARIAAVVAGLATGPFRVQMPGWVAETRRRIDLAGRWAASAESVRRLHENTLTPLSTASHAGR